MYYNPEYNKPNKLYNILKSIKQAMSMCKTKDTVTYNIWYSWEKAS